MRTLYFLFPGMGLQTGGHTAQVRFLEAAQTLCETRAVTYQGRHEGVPYLDDILEQTVEDDAIFIVHWGPHIPELLQTLTGRNVVYVSQSTGYRWTLPPSVPILCGSRNTLAFWGRFAPNAPLFWLPNVLGDEFENRHVDRDIDVLVQRRKSSEYLLSGLVPLLMGHCSVLLLDTWVDDLASILNRSKVYLYDSSEYWNRAGVTEGFGLPPLEAMACGCTVFSSVNDALADFLDPGFNCHKLRLYSMEYDVRRVLEAVNQHGEREREGGGEALHTYRMPNVRARLESILIEVNRFFDSRPGLTQDVPSIAHKRYVKDRPLASRFERLRRAVPSPVKYGLKKVVGEHWF